MYSSPDPSGWDAPPRQRTWREEVHPDDVSPSAQPLWPSSADTAGRTRSRSSSLFRAATSLSVDAETLRHLRRQQHQHQQQPGASMGVSPPTRRPTTSAVDRVLATMQGRPHPVIRRAAERSRARHQSLTAPAPEQQRDDVFDADAAVPVPPVVAAAATAHTASEDQPVDRVAAEPHGGEETSEPTSAVHEDVTAARQDNVAESLDDNRENDAARANQVEESSRSRRTSTRDWTPFPKVTITGQETSKLITCVHQVGPEFDDQIPLLVTDGKHVARMETNVKNLHPGDVLMIFSGQLIAGSRAVIFADAVDVKVFSNEHEEYRGMDNDLPRYDWTVNMGTHVPSPAATSLSTISNSVSHEHASEDVKAAAVEDIYEYMVTRTWDGGDQYGIVVRMLRERGVKPTRDFLESAKILSQQLWRLKRDTLLLIPHAEFSEESLRKFIHTAAGYSATSVEDNNHTTDTMKHKLGRIKTAMKRMETLPYTDGALNPGEAQFEHYVVVKHFADDLQAALLQNNTLLASCSWSEIMNHSCSRTVLRHISSEVRHADTQAGACLQWVHKAITLEKKLLTRLLAQGPSWSVLPEERTLTVYLNRLTTQMKAARGCEVLTHRVIYDELAGLKHRIDGQSAPYFVCFRSGGLLSYTWEAARENMCNAHSPFFHNLWGNEASPQFIDEVSQLDPNGKGVVLLERIIQVLRQTSEEDKHSAHDAVVSSGRIYHDSDTEEDDEVPVPRRSQGPRSTANSTKGNKDRSKQQKNRSRSKQRQISTSSHSSSTSNRSAKANGRSSAKFKRFDTAKTNPTEVTVGLTMAGLDAEGRLDASDGTLAFIGYLMRYEVEAEQGQRQFHQLVCDEAEAIILHAIETEAPEADLLTKPIAEANSKTWKKLRSYMVCFHCGNTGKQKPHSWTRCQHMQSHRGQTKQGKAALQEFLSAGKQTQYTTARKRLLEQQRMDKFQASLQE